MRTWRKKYHLVWAKPVTWCLVLSPKSMTDLTLLSCWGSWQKISWYAFCVYVCASTYNSIWTYLLCMGMQQLKRTILYKTRIAQLIHHQEIETKWEYLVVPHLEKRKWPFTCKRSCDFFLCAPFWSQTSLAVPVNLGSAPLMATARDHCTPCLGVLLLLQCAPPAPAAGLGVSVHGICASCKSKIVQRFYLGI